MNQESIKDKKRILNKYKLRTRHWFLEVSVILSTFFAVWLMISLFSFHPSDASWSQTAWHETVHNLGGPSGAWIADMLFFIFGIIGYAIPLLIINGCWLAWNHWKHTDYIDYFAISLRLIGVIVLILSSCSLAEIQIDDIWYFVSGGVIGNLLSSALLQQLSRNGGILVLLWIWAVGLSLFTGLSWMGIAEKIGIIIFNILSVSSRNTSQHTSWVAYKDNN